MYNANGLIQGWQCPVCGRVLSPFTAECPCYREKNTHTITDKSATTNALRADTSTTIVSAEQPTTKTEPFGGII